MALTVGHIWPWASRKPKQIKETRKMCTDLNLYTVIPAKNECMTMSLSWKSFSKHYKWTTIQPLSLPPPFHHLLPSLPTTPAMLRGPASLCPEYPRVVWWGRLPFSHTGINISPSFSVSPPHSAFCSPFPNPPRTAHPLLPLYPEQTPTMDPVHLGCHRLGTCRAPSERDCPFLTVSAQQMFTVKLWERRKRWWDRK